MIKLIFKKTFKWFGIILLVSIISGFIPAALGFYGLFWERWTTSLLGNPLNPRLSWYQPLEMTKGDYTNPLETLDSNKSEIPLEAFQKASDYAESHNSNSLVIQHKGKIVFENYWNDTNFDSLFGLHSLTKTMNGILMGHAIEDGFIESVDVSASVFINED